MAEFSFFVFAVHFGESAGAVPTIAATAEEGAENAEKAGELSP